MTTLRPALRATALVTALASFAGCDRAPETVDGPPPIRVRTVAVAWSDAATPVTTEGVLARRTESALSFKTGGVVRAIAVRTGEAVRAGDELASLDPAEIDAEVARAAATVEKARRDLERAEALLGGRVIALDQAQDARTGLEVAEAALRAAEFNRRFAIITAPADGVILSREAEPDELIAAGRPVLRFAPDAEPWIVRAGVGEAELAGIRVGSPARVTIAGRPPLAAEVTRLAGRADAATRTVSLEITPAEPPADLRSGFVAQVEIRPDDVAPRPVVPLEALVAGEGRRAHVFLLADDARSVRRVEVTIAGLHAGSASLESPLPEGARLVTTGAEFLTDGAAVEAVD